MGYPEEEARGALRLSLGRTTTEAEIETAADVVPRVIASMRQGPSRSPRIRSVRASACEAHRRGGNDLRSGVPRSFAVLFIVARILPDDLGRGVLLTFIGLPVIALAALVAGWIAAMRSGRIAGVIEVALAVILAILVAAVLASPISD